MMHEVTMNDPYGRSGASEFAGSPGPIHRGLNPLSSVSVYRVVNITVGEPQKEGRGLNAKTTYLIQTEVLKSGFPETRIVYNARRRYTEFRTLYDEFRKLSNSEFKTPFPPKSFKKFNDKLIEERQEAFSQLILEYVENPFLLNNTQLKNFLSIPPQQQLVAPSSLPSNVPSTLKFKFSSVLKNEEMKYTFKQFLIEEHNIEPFEFLESCYQIECNGNILIEEFDRLVIEEFVETGSGREINIDNKTRSKLLKEWQELKSMLSKQTDLVMWKGQLDGILQQAIVVVKIHLKTDSFPRFVYNWPTFKKFIASKNDAFIASITKGESQQHQLMFL